MPTSPQHQIEFIRRSETVGKPIGGNNFVPAAERAAPPRRIGPCEHGDSRLLLYDLVIFRRQVYASRHFSPHRLLLGDSQIWTVGSWWHELRYPVRIQKLAVDVVGFQ